MLYIFLGCKDCSTPGPRGHFFEKINGFPRFAYGSIWPPLFGPEYHVPPLFYKGFGDFGPQNDTSFRQNSTFPPGFIRVLGDFGVDFGSFLDPGKDFSGFWSREHFLKKSKFLFTKLSPGNFKPCPGGGGSPL